MFNWEEDDLAKSGRSPGVDFARHPRLNLERNLQAGANKMIVDRLNGKYYSL